MSETLNTGPITHAEAREIAKRYNASHWSQKPLGEKARYTIPADPRRDDDIRLDAYIDQMEALEARATAAEERVKVLEEALTRHKHTDECLAYAASTGKSFCIAPCMDARTALAREGEKA